MSEPSTEPTTPAAQPATPPTAAPPAAAPAETDPPKAPKDDIHNADGTVNWQAAARKWEKEAKAARKQALTDEQKQQLDEYNALLEASQSDMQRKEAEMARQATEMARWQTEAEKWRTTSVTSRIEAIAATSFDNPGDAVLVLSEPSKYLDAGGVIDEAAIKADLEAVLEQRPHWRRQESTPTSPRVPAPNRNQGSGGNGGGSDLGEPREVFARLLHGSITGTK